MLLAVVVAVAGCGEADQPVEPQPAARTAKDASPPRWPRRARCAPAAENCTAARGTVVYVERVDPDGDGDAHLVLTSSESVTAPGITAIDIKKSLRPHPLPRIGDRVSAAGPVYEGSHGQLQIEATVLHVAR